MKFTIAIELPDEMLRAEARGWLDNHFSSSGHFSIMLIDKMLKHLNIEAFRKSRLYTYLYSLHCVDFKNMKPETLKKCKEICYALVTPPKKKIEDPVYHEEDLV